MTKKILSLMMGKMKNERGSLLVTAYLIIFMLVSFGAAYMIVSINEARFSERQKMSIKAFHIAEAGIERALFDLRIDFTADTTSPAWNDGTINTFTIGPNTASFYAIPYVSTVLGDGSYTVRLQNIAGQGDEIWIQSTATVGDATQSLLVYVRMINISPWNNAIFAGAGASGATVNGNVNIRGSVHILGTGLASTDYAVDLGGTADLIGNNYNGLDASLLAKVPTLPTTTFGGETVSTLDASLRVKRGIIGLSGSATAGDVNVAGNSVKETITGSYVTDGYGGSQGTTNVNSDNGWSNSYDLGDSVTFPSLSDPYGAHASYQAYLRANALVLTTELSSITPTSSFSYSDANGSISMDGSGNMTISGIVYVDGSNNLAMNKVGSDKTITYSGTGSILVTGDASINVNLVTSGASSFPTNVMGIMTPNTISMTEAGTDVMGLFYAEDQVTVSRQTDIMGTIVSNYFDMGTNVPSIFQVPETVNNLPPGIIGSDVAMWSLDIVSWQRQ
jgi:hypothetical protein